MKLIIIGAGGFGREAAWTAETAGFEVAGVCDDDPGAAPRCAGRPFFGAIENAVRDGRVAVAKVRFFVAIGTNAVRRALFERAEACGLKPASVISPHALIAPTAVVGEGSYAGPGCVISVGTRLGRGVIVNNLASVGHDVTIGDFAQVCPGATLSGHTVLGEHAFIGSNACTVPGVKVGARAKVAAGTPVFANVADDATLSPFGTLRR